MEINNVREKLELYASILDDLKKAHVVRTYNSPVGDYAEWLVSKKLELDLEKNSKAGYDAKDKNHDKYQIKSCWLHSGKNKRQFNVIRKYTEKEFDFLIAVVFDDKFQVTEAYKIPHDVIGQYFSLNKHQNGIVVTLTNKFLKDERVEDIKTRIK